MYRYLDAELKLHLLLTDSLQHIYGVGRQKSLYVMNMLGLPDNFFSLHLTSYIFDYICYFFNFYILGQRLKFLIKQRLDAFRQSKMVKGLRYF
jgi:ribosomal protein S13